MASAGPQQPEIQKPVSSPLCTVGKPLIQAAQALHTASNSKAAQAVGQQLRAVLETPMLSRLLGCFAACSREMNSPAKFDLEHDWCCHTTSLQQRSTCAWCMQPSTAQVPYLPASSTPCISTRLTSAAHCCCVAKLISSSTSTTPRCCNCCTSMSAAAVPVACRGLPAASWQCSRSCCCLACWPSCARLVLNCCICSGCSASSS